MRDTVHPRKIADIKTNAKEGKMLAIPDSTPIKTKGTPPRLKSIKQILRDPAYSWVTHSYIRHAVFRAEDQSGSGGVRVAGNGLAPAIIRINRKILIDLDEFDQWVERHRMGRS